MSATNSTTHYELPSFLGSDKPAWLVDWNGAMATIDSAIYEAKQAADTASASASAVASDLATLSGTVSTQGSTISTLSETLTTAVGNINTINGNITTINSLIGNGTPTTTDQTIIGAINEINANVTDDQTSGTLANEVAGISASLTLKELQAHTTWTTAAPNAKTLPASFKMLVFAVDNPAGDGEVSMLPAEMIASLPYNHFSVTTPSGKYRFTFSSNTVVCDSVTYNSTEIVSDSAFTKGITISYY